MKDKFKQNVITLKFMEIYHELLDKRIVVTPTEFSKKIGSSPQSFYQVQKGMRNITLEQIVNLLESFKDIINPFYLFGIGNILLNPDIDNIPDYRAQFNIREEKGVICIAKENSTVYNKNTNINSLEDKIKFLEEIIKSKDDIIRSKDDLIKVLKRDDNK